MSSSTEPQRNGAQAVVDALVAEGVDHVFGLPGTTIMDVLDALGQEPRIRYLSVRHEQAAAHMADGFWRASGRVAVCLASRGPGAANMTIGVHNAFAESIPLLALVGQVPNQVVHQGAFEEMDIVSFFRPITKWAISIDTPARLDGLVRRAVRMSRQGRPRPVLVSIPLDVLQASTGAIASTSTTAALTPAPSPESIAPAVELLARAERPVIVVGGGVQRAASYCEPVIRLAEALGAPVVTTWLRKGAFPNQHPLYVGALGYGAHQVAEQAVREADVLLAMGCRFSEFTTKRYSLLQANTAIIHVDIDATEIGAIYPTSVGIVADAGGTAATIASLLSGGDRPAIRLSRTAELRASYETETALVEMRNSEGGVESGAVVHALRRLVDRHDPIIVQDTHSFGPWISRHVEFRRPGAYYGAAGGSMGWGLPAALGVQAARPAERVVAICGDGSFWMVAQELETAVREHLPVVVIITNNFSYGNTRDRQRTAHGGRYIGVFYSNPDFAAYARLLGAHGERVEHADGLDGAIERAMAAGVPAVIDVVQDCHEGLPSDLQPPPAR